MGEDGRNGESGEKAGGGVTAGRRFVPQLLLAAATLAAYGSLGAHQFVGLDDYGYVASNPQVTTGLTGRSLLWAFTAFYQDNWHPLTWISHMIDVELFGLAPRGHHLVNLVLHLANGLLVFSLLRDLTRREWPSFLVAAAFLLHPLHVESVAWVAERKDLLSTLFFLLALRAYGRCVARPSKARIAAPVLLFALGLLAKPMIVTLPFVLLLLDYWPLGRWPTAGAGTMRRLVPLVLEKVPFLVLAAASSAVTLVAQKNAMTVISPPPLGLRLSNAAVSYLSYLADAFWPHDLTVLYPYPEGGIPALKVFAAGATLLALTAAVVRLGRTRRYLLVGWLWYLGTLLPVIGLVQVGFQARADRYTYIPSLGIFLMVAWGLAEVAGRRPSLVRPLAVASAAALLALVGLTRHQVSFWRDNLALFGRALEVTEGNFLAHFNYSNALLEAGRAPEAEEHVREALRLRPGHRKARENFAGVLSARGRHEEALAELQALAREPGATDPTVYSAIAANQAHLGRYQEAADSLRAFVARNLEDVDARFRLGTYLVQAGRISEAGKEWELVLARAPHYPTLRLQLGRVALTEGRTDEAAAHFAAALDEDPRDPLSHFFLGVIAQQRGSRAQAVVRYRQTLALQPDNFPAAASLTDLLRDAGLSGEARAVAQNALEQARAKGAQEWIGRLSAALAQLR